MANLSYSTSSLRPEKSYRMADVYIYVLVMILSELFSVFWIGANVIVSMINQQNIWLVIIKKGVRRTYNGHTTGNSRTLCVGAINALFTLATGGSTDGHVTNFKVYVHIRQRYVACEKCFFNFLIF